MTMSMPRVALPRTWQQFIRSEHTDREYQIMVAIPHSPPPEAGYPVTYVLDGNSVFGTMMEAVRLQSRRPEKTGVLPQVIVGIGYRTEEPFDPARMVDYSLPIPREELPSPPGRESWPEYGGADRFLRVIEEEVKPLISQHVQIDRTKQSLFGHSLGGLFVLHTLFTKPKAFQTYIAGSPSIHFGRQLLREEEAEFVQRLHSGAGQQAEEARLMIAMGELEERHPSRMYELAEAMAIRLAPLEGQGLKVEFRVFAEENHTSVLPVLISRALRFSS
ncbi:alpha/beta hydrolase [Paenibacillus guangzhouensis]|uniref:alpha/beta hydrolase n=1 Tax=Paenibacillus guangzhouensis TaxID=1473112 RepID=UPI0012671EE2|nr:alpha/beta hydrolase-fold protein [Paenibacillus guangzhouensis]